MRPFLDDESDSCFTLMRLFNNTIHAFLNSCQHEALLSSCWWSLLTIVQILTQNVCMMTLLATLHEQPNVSPLQSTSTHLMMTQTKHKDKHMSKLRRRRERYKLLILNRKHSTKVCWHSHGNKLTIIKMWVWSINTMIVTESKAIIACVSRDPHPSIVHFIQWWFHYSHDGRHSLWHWWDCPLTWALNLINTPTFVLCIRHVAGHLLISFAGSSWAYRIDWGCQRSVRCP